ncbi:MAG: UDP-3-O-(3-hydroxymyristoyl)glucosamine N-acyltransferase [Steroidobacteraceae bacterium]|jgi:UDP-3-O-[3-hydroxymyristoyl] glucosamine N-acyltransferase|nr:UDP-3-O-(3-hydroxymyristoyl)glucosamine N-acyltransferase [Steroidobacteraceae bacterium]
MGISLGALAVRFGLELQGDPDAEVATVASLREAGPGSVSFLANPRYRRYLAETRAGAVVLDRAAAAECPVPALIAANPYAAYARIAAELYPVPPVAPGVHPSAVVDPAARVSGDACIGPQAIVEAGAEIGPRALVGPASVVMAGARIGADTRLVARVTVYPGVVIGMRGVLHAGAVIGADGFGFAPDRDGFVKVPQVGSVRIGDDVEIGANTTVDRGAIEDTVIEDGVKLDNLVQVGHNVRIGAHTVVAGCAGISGSTTIGRRCMIGGAAGTVGHIEIADDVVVSGLTMVTRSLKEPGMYSSGWPAVPADEWRRIVAHVRRLERLDQRVARLEGRRKGGQSEGEG